MIYEFLIIFLAKYLGWILGVSAVIIFLWPFRSSLIPAFARASAGRRANGSRVVEAFGSAFVARFGVAEIIRYFYGRPRPFQTGDFLPLIPHEGGGAFPSGHAVFLFALATSVFIYNRRWGMVFFVGAFLVGAGRVLAGLHWPSDILGGAVVGILTSIFVNYLFRRYHPQISEKAE